MEQTEFIVHLNKSKGLHNTNYLHKYIYKYINTLVLYL